MFNHDLIETVTPKEFENAVKAAEYVQARYWVKPVSFPDTDAGDLAYSKFNKNFLVTDRATNGTVHYSGKR